MGVPLTTGEVEGLQLLFIRRMNLCWRFYAKKF